MNLIATHPILYQSTQYEVGQSLPAHDSNMVQAWLEAGTAVWKKNEQQVCAKAKPTTSITGLAGESKNGETAENMVGRVPKTSVRSRGSKKND